ncbi:MAG TPA: RidA family protein [Dehalococcoidia bacterium]|nr:RidA family protein [Dehalococcoidia bacterium]
MERRAINPWTWQDHYGFNQAIEVSGHQRTLICSGQTSVDAEGNPVHAGDIAAQIAQALDNLEAVLTKAGMTLQNVVRLNMYTTDMDACLGSFGVMAERLGAAGCQQATTLLGVNKLFAPSIMVELEAIAVA